MSHYIGLILTVGMTHEPVIYSIQQANATSVAFICTPDSERLTLDTVITETNLRPSQWRKYVVADDPQHIGRLCIEFYNAYQWLITECGLHPSKIAVDPTAGRKWMSTGTTMIAAFLGLVMHYVDVRFVGGKPDPGSMKIVELGNAYDQTGFIEAEKGRAFFNGYNFEPAAQLFARLRPSLSQQADLYEGLTALAQACDCWERFEHYHRSLTPDFDIAFAHLDRYLHSLPMPHQPLTLFVEQVKELSTAIEALYTSDRPSICFIVDVFENAQRRIHQGRFDDACGRLYRTLEAISQYCLQKDFHIEAAHASYDGLSEETRRQIEAGLGDLPQKIDLATGFKLLKILDHQVGHLVIFSKGTKQSNKFSGLLEARDHSILAHGFESIPTEKVNEFNNRLRILLQDAFSEQFHSWSERLQIPPLPSLIQ